MDILLDSIIEKFIQTINSKNSNFQLIQNFECHKTYGSAPKIYYVMHLFITTFFLKLRN